MAYKIRFVDGPLAGQTEKIAVLFNKITKYPESTGVKPVTYYRKDNPYTKLAEYKYSVKP